MEVEVCVEREREGEEERERGQVRKIVFQPSLHSALFFVKRLQFTC